jgi:hypothetical protein
LSSYSFTRHYKLNKYRFNSWCVHYREKLSVAYISDKIKHPNMFFNVKRTLQTGIKYYLYSNRISKAVIVKKYIMKIEISIACLPDNYRKREFFIMKCPVCGKSAWRTVVRKENPGPASKTFVTALYRVCTKCGYEEKL